jgi:dihydrofolate reductase
MILHGITAMGQNRQIGLKNSLPWHNKDELSHFKMITSGHILIMGRKTFDSIGRPLPNRKTIVISRDKKENTKNVIYVKTPEEAIAVARFSKQDSQKVFVCGGESIYKHFMSDISFMIISEMEYNGKADTFFPEFEKDFVCKRMVNHVNKGF